MTIRKLHRPCPICASSDGEILHHQKFQLSDNSILPDNYDVVCCTYCGFVFADTTVGQDIYNQYYSEFSKYEDANSAVSTGGGTSVWDKKRIEATCDDISKYAGKESFILDIGCANGGILNDLKGRGFKNLFGLDPSKSCCAYVNNLGIECFLGELFEAKRYLQGKKFDFIILSHVLEHIYDLKRAAGILNDLLNDGGIVYVEVPDAASYSNYYVVPYYYFDPEHINHLDQVSLQNLFCSNSFEKVFVGGKSFFVNDTMRYPAAFGFFKKNLGSAAFTFIQSNKVKNEVLGYVKMSAERSALSDLTRLAKSQEPVMVFGAGNFTARLLETTELASCNIAAFVDNDSKKQGTTFNGKEVLSATAIKEFKGPVLICSALFFQQIADQLRNELGIKNEIIVIR